MKKQVKITVFTALVFNDRGEILITKRYEPELTSANEKWELPGGKAEESESAFQALVREIYEETGYTIEPLKQISDTFISEWEYPDSYQHTSINCFISKLLTIEKEISSDHHVSSVKWINPAKIGEYPTLPGVSGFVEKGLTLFHFMNSGADCPKTHFFATEN
jgi:8-oxo-dGTP diphosphatase